jgi:hypothetical protein
MKQNERLLVYVVTGFLALILVIAVIFGNDPAQAARKQKAASKGLREILSPKVVEDPAVLRQQGQLDLVEGNQGSVQEDATNGSVASEPVREAPLIAKPLVAADVVARELGQSRRDRGVRFVRAKSGDSLPVLVVRWCGDLAGIEEARTLNEDSNLSALRIGQEVGLPWVDDEVLIERIESRKPRTLSVKPGVVPATGALPANRVVSDEIGLPRPSSVSTAPRIPGAARPGFSEPVKPSPMGVDTYRVKDGESLWGIAAKRYGAKKASDMVVTIKELNQLQGDRIGKGQSLKLPKTAN